MWTLCSRKLENLEGDRDENSEVKGVNPSKTHWFSPFIYCLLTILLLFLFLIFSSPFFIFLCYFSSSSDFFWVGGGCSPHHRPWRPSLNILGGDTSPSVPPPLPPPAVMLIGMSEEDGLVLTDRSGVYIYFIISSSQDLTRR